MELPHVIVGVHVMNRTEHALDVQNLLTEFGACIQTRLGLHHVEPGVSSPSGIIILELCDETAGAEMIAKLNAIEGVEAKTMTFEH